VHPTTSDVQGISSYQFNIATVLALLAGFANLASTQFRYISFGIAGEVTTAANTRGIDNYTGGYATGRAACDARPTCIAILTRELVHRNYVYSPSPL
jgi:hypothetical protein